MKSTVLRGSASVLDAHFQDCLVRVWLPTLGKTRSIELETRTVERERVFSLGQHLS